MRKMAIKTKIMLWYTSLLALLLGLVIPLIYFTMKSTMYDNAESLLRIHTSQALENFEFENDKLELSGFKNISGTSFMILDINGEIIINTGINRKFNTLEPNFDTIINFDDESGNWLIFDQQLVEDEENIGWIRAYGSLESVHSALSNLKITILIASPIYLLIGVLGGLFISKKSLKPIDDITKTAQVISTGDLSQRLNMVNTGDEVSRLAQTFDEMIDKLEVSLAKEKKFTANASHELRTPISVIMANSEDMLARDYSANEYKEAISLILSESKKMRRMISKLLMLSRGDETSFKYEFEDIDLGSLIEGIVDEMLNYTKEKNILINYGYKDNIIIEADQTLIIRLIMNLIDNAIKYNDGNSQIEIFLSRKGKLAEIILKDKGIGISKEDLPNIYNRFYRADKSRSSEGAGLGLSIVKHIVDIHKGEIHIESELSIGTTVKVLLPLKI